jgi:hypothetical protein
LIHRPRWLCEAIWNSFQQEFFTYNWGKYNNAFLPGIKMLWPRSIDAIVHIRSAPEANQQPYALGDLRPALLGYDSELFSLAYAVSTIWPAWRIPRGCC